MLRHRHTDTHTYTFTRSMLPEDLNHVATIKHIQKLREVQKRLPRLTPTNLQHFQSLLEVPISLSWISGH